MIVDVVLMETHPADLTPITSLITLSECKRTSAFGMAAFKRSD
jgi:hypothetical protein